MVAHPRPAALILAAIALVTVGCGGPRFTGTRPDSKIGSDAVSHVELTVDGLKSDEVELFRRQLLERKMKNVVLKSLLNGTAVYELDLDGCECEFPSKILDIPNPGFRYDGRSTKVHYTAYDNRAPTLVYLFPAENQLLFDADPWVVVETPDEDVAEITINGVRAVHWRGALYRAQVHLKDGVQELVAVARDKSGNESRTTQRVAEDTSAGMQAQLITSTIDGNLEPGSVVLVEGYEFPVDATGRYRAQLKVRNTQRQVNIVAISPKAGRLIIQREVPETRPADQR